jgi:hypothetical protein
MRINSQMCSLGRNLGILHSIKRGRLMSLERSLKFLRMGNLFRRQKQKPLANDRPFRLVRYFAFTSLTAFAIALYGLNKLY